MSDHDTDDQHSANIDILGYGLGSDHKKKGLLNKLTKFSKHSRDQSNSSHGSGSQTSTLVDDSSSSLRSECFHSGAEAAAYAAAHVNEKRRKNWNPFKGKKVPHALEESANYDPDYVSVRKVRTRKSSHTRNSALKTSKSTSDLSGFAAQNGLPGYRAAPPMPSLPPNAVGYTPVRPRARPPSDILDPVDVPNITMGRDVYYTPFYHASENEAASRAARARAAELYLPKEINFPSQHDQGSVSSKSRKNWPKNPFPRKRAVTNASVGPAPRQYREDECFFEMD